MKLLQKLEGAFKTNLREHLKNGGLLLSGSTLTSVLAFVTSIVYANVLPKEIYGEYRYLLGIFNIFNSLALTGMNTAVTQAVSRGHDGALIATIKTQMRWGMAHTLIGVGASIIFLLSSQVMTAIGMLLISLMAPISNALNTTQAFLQGKRAYKATNYATIFQSFLVYGSLITVAYFTKTTLWILAANLIAVLGSNIIIFFWVKRSFNPPLDGDASTSVFGTKLSLISALRIIADQMDVFIVHNLMSPIDLAIFAVTTTIPDRLRGQWKIAQSLQLPNHSKRVLTEIVPPLRKKAMLLAAAAITVCVPIAFCMPWLFTFIYKQYAPYAYLAQIYTFSIVGGLSLLPYTALLSQQREKPILASVGLSIAVYLPLLIAGTVLFGLPGAVIAKTINSYVELGISWMMLEIDLRRLR